MAIELNPKQLKKKLIEIWNNYIKNPSDNDNIESAKEVYTKYWEAAVFILPKNQVRAVIALVDICYNTGIKIDKKKAEEILRELSKN